MSTSHWDGTMAISGGCSTGVQRSTFNAVFVETFSEITQPNGLWHSGLRMASVALHLTFPQRGDTNSG